MSKLNHTPGPWENHYGLIVNESQAAPVICSMFSKDEQDFHNTPANARLIVVAPDMLDALVDEMKKRKVKCPECHYACTHFSEECLVMKHKTLIESATGLPIEEVLK